MIRLFVALGILHLLSADARTASKARPFPTDAARAERIKRLYDSFDEVARMDAPNQQERRKRTDQIAARIHEEVDAFVDKSLLPKYFHPTSAERAIRDLLGLVVDGGPSVFIAESHLGCFALAYTLQKGSAMGYGATSPTVRVYCPDHNRFRLSAVNRSDMDGYGSMQVLRLNSPIAGELWLLLCGQMTGANGPNIRMRVYAYGERAFRPVWMPENAWGGFTARVTPSGFRVDSDYYRKNKFRHDRYLLGPDGVYRSTH